MPQSRSIFFLVLCFLYGFWPACLQARELQIAVAGSYLPAARSLGKDFGKTSRQSIHWISASTGSLFAQIQNGAPFDAYLAADLEHPIALLREGKAVADSLFIYEKGRLVFWAKKHTVFNKNIFQKKRKRESRNPDLPWTTLLLEGQTKVAVPNPRLAPFGKAAHSFLLRQKLWRKLAENRRILYASGVGQAFFYVRSGAVGGGFISLRQLLSLPRAERGFFYLIPEKEHPPVLQAAVILQDGSTIREFWDFFRKSALLSVGSSSLPSLPKEEIDFFVKKEMQKKQGRPKSMESQMDGRTKGRTKGRIGERKEQSLLPKSRLPKKRQLQKREDSKKNNFFFLQDSDWQALFLSLRLAAFSSLILLLAATPLAWMLTLFRWPPKFSSLRLVLDAALTLPLVLPPTVLGFYLLLLLGGPEEGGLAFGFWGILVGSCIYSLPFAVQPLRDAFAGIGRRPLEAAASCKARPWDAFFSIIIPMSRGGYLSAAVLSFAHTLGEFGVVLMLGGSIPGETRVASIAIFEHVEALEYGRAHRLALCLLSISFFLIFFLYAFRQLSDAWYGKRPR